MYSQQLRNGYFRALPIYNIISKDIFNETINEKEMKRIKDKFLYMMLRKIMFLLIILFILKVILRKQLKNIKIKNYIN